MYKKEIEIRKKEKREGGMDLKGKRRERENEGNVREKKAEIRKRSEK